MLIRKPTDLRYSDVTPRKEYLNRRSFLSAAGIAAAGAVGFLGTQKSAQAISAKLPNVAKSPLSLTSEKPTPIEAITSYNNYYEFGTGKDEPAKNAQKFRTNPWALTVDGEVGKKLSFSYDELFKIAPLEERIYRMRCVEAWSVVVPWVGFPLNALIKQAQPTAKAKFIAFESYYDTKQMPQGRFAGIQLPYVEGLRMDEAMHPLTILAVGLYGETLPNQDGAPIRLVVPWKYGFKGIKSIVKIRLVGSQPPSTWNISAPNEYGFYSNVNPAVDHPRWTQATERRLGDLFRRKTLPFNGYGDQVASLYAGMDLKKYY
jgi:methionine sulfoxide reductase catalytic subunit